MKLVLVGAAGALFFSAGAFADAKYEASLTCLRSLSAAATNPPVVFDRAGNGYYPTTSGFLIFTPKSAYTFPQAEMTKSGDSTTQTKISVLVPGQDPVKIFYNQSATTPKERVTFALANEFDRNVAATPAEEQGAQEILQIVIGRTFYSTKNLVLTDKAAMAAALEPCKPVTWDFPIETGSGTESKFQTEVRLIRDRLKPSVFSMEYWFPKKGTSSN